MTKLVTQLALCAAFCAVQATCWADPAPLPTLSPPPPPVLLNVPPPFPLPSEVPPPEFLIYAFPAAGLSIDTSNREAVRVFFKGLYFQSDNLAINWTGQQATCAAGTTDQRYQDAVALRVNWFRAMAGVPARVNLYGPYSQQDQPAALVMSTNNSLSHTPPSNWSCWGQTAYDAAGKSNLSLGLSGASAVSGYILDNGTSNAPLGHRRWVLYPQTENMGTGDVPAGSYNTASVMAANALWVLDSHTYDTRPAVRDDFVAWPPKGYVPYQVVYGRWSLSHSSADFTNATVTVSKGGVNIPVSIEALHNGYGENTIVWLLQGVNDITVWPKPAADDTYAVTVANVWLNGVARTFNYNVTVFDPDTPTPSAAQTVVSAPVSASVNSAFAVSLTPMTNASSYQLALYRLASLAGAFTSASNASAWTYVTGPATPYNPIETTSFHLYHSNFANQSLTLDKKLYIGQNASLSFLSWFTYAMSGQVAHVQISLDDGASWQDVYTEVGSNNTAQSTKIVDLAQFAGHFARLKYEFVYILGQSYYYQPSTGWYFNNITLDNVSEMLDGQTVSVAASQSKASFTVTTAGSFALAGRTEYQGSYFTDWGQASVFQVSAATPSSSFPGNRSNYSITKTSTGFSVTDKVGAGGTVALTGSTQIIFTDMTVNLLIGDLSKTIDPASLKTLVELYVAFFNRIPGADGLSYWIDQMSAGQSINQIAGSFYAAGIQYSSLTGFSAGMSNDDFINTVFRNVLDRPAGASADGLAYWRGKLLDGSATHGSLVTDILASAHSFKGDPTWGWVADLLDNKYLVANYFCLQQGLNYNTPEIAIAEGMAIAAAVTPTSTDAAIALSGVTDAGLDLTLP